VSVQVTRAAAADEEEEGEGTEEGTAEEGEDSKEK